VSNYTIDWDVYVIKNSLRLKNFSIVVYNRDIFFNKSTMTELSEDLNNTPIAVILRGAEVESDEHGEGGVLRTQGTIHPGGFIVFFTDGSGINLELSQVQGQMAP
jgi:hypothetical protein